MTTQTRRGDAAETTAVPSPTCSCAFDRACQVHEQPEHRPLGKPPWLDRVGAAS